MLGCKARVEPPAEMLPLFAVFGEQGFRTDEVVEDFHGGRFGGAPGVELGGAGYLLGEVVGCYDGHGVGDGPEVDEEDGGVV